ncbi:Crp/Fnr family transcriptional regulator [Pseudoponticoccus marisrubri]|uniref:Crp/Fnr family transcriptional regulator n=1 Tax=Pseudoponticoccus marisrubri TaxID=1685382 RepID=A0A0W7WJ90_9RHOB|nr:Crp/Fnr family transcriptional regulator [Pseudoponticoccus marisrubri]KUF10593.1 Crp/Fnr family transcriptional regulator [Pseudoponticoccus marisrubri]
MKIDCATCPLRQLELFLPMSSKEVAFMKRFKTGEFAAQPGTEILAEDASSSQLFTVLSGMGLRSKTLPNGRRQVVGFVLPGDFVGLQSGVMDAMRHSVEATTRMVLCVFNRSDLWQLFEQQPERAFDLTYLAASEEHLLGEALQALGQMTAEEKISWALGKLYMRLSALGQCRENAVPLPYKQQDLADALGLSLVHTNKTLAKLREKQIASWSGGTLIVHDRDELYAMGHLDRQHARPRPLI